MVATIGRCYTNPQDYAQENYYSQGEGLANSEWLGKAAIAQGLSGQIQEKHFHNAYQALDPVGNPLRKQQNYRKQSQRHNRPGTDVTLSAPKSISVAALVMGDRQILEAHQAAVRSTMDYVEKNCIFYQAKQRGNKLLLNSKTAQIAVFHHDDNRNKDPQLHSHCVILNQTLCPDGKWRAVANRELYVQIKTIGAYYAHELARQLKQIGWEVEWTDDHTFELAGVDKDKLDAIFSTRSNQIEAELSKQGLTRKTATAEQKQALCLKTRREKKHHHQLLDRERQLAQWQRIAAEAGLRITKDDRTRLEQAYNQLSHPGSLPELLHSATEILTERQTAFQKHEFLKECLRQSQGRADPKQIQTEIDRFRELVPTRDGRVTTKNQLRREQKIIQLAASGRDSREPNASREQAMAIALSKGLNSGQTAALIHVATSRDAVVLVQGNAGVGKTYTMRALFELLARVGKEKGKAVEAELAGRTRGDKSPSSDPARTKIRGVAPSAAAANVLQKESGIDSQTLASYLLTANERLPQGEVLLVDEAGMLSTKQMEQLLEKARATNSRIVLVGDTKQLSAVEAGAPFKLLQELGLPTAVIDQNLRQRDPFLKQVVDSIATHESDSDSVNVAYQRLNEQGKIKQIVKDERRVAALSSDYLSRPTEVRHKTLILAGTNADKLAIASTVRQGLIAEGTLGNESLKIQTLRRKELDRFAITQAHHYQRGDVIKFQTDSARFSKDLYYRVISVKSETQTATLIDTVGLTETLPLDKYKQREVYQVQTLEIRPGERMRFTKNIRHSNYKQLNGQRFTIEGIKPDGSLAIKTNGKIQKINPERLLHSDYSYVDTVHSSQGQTADYCIYSAASAKSLTVGRESFYVAASRARQEFVVYTANAIDLGVTVQLSRANENASELVAPTRLSREERKTTAPAQQKSRHSNEESQPVQNWERQRASQVKDSSPSSSQQPSATSESSYTPEEPSKSKSDSSAQTSRHLSDAELIAQLRALEQWKRKRPRQPNLERGEHLKRQVERLQKQKAELERQYRSQQAELKRLGQPRSLLNPFGPRSEVIWEKEVELGLTSREIEDTKQLEQYALENFSQWQQEARAYLAWEKSPETKKMMQLAEEFSSPHIQQRLQFLEEAYAIHAAASFILARAGIESGSERYVRGESYRIEQRGKTLTIYHKDRFSPLYQATDRRKTGGIIEISQLNLTQEEREKIHGSARYLEQQERELQQSRYCQRGGFEIGD
jgi:conjugative relaxase-like TrwC/TraI family protein